MDRNFPTHVYRAKVLCFWIGIAAFVLIAGYWILGLIEVVQPTDTKQQFLNGFVGGVMATLIASFIRPDE